MLTRQAEFFCFTSKEPNETHKISVKLGENKTRRGLSEVLGVWCGRASWRQCRVLATPLLSLLSPRFFFLHHTTPRPLKNAFKKPSVPAVPYELHVDDA